MASEVSVSSKAYSVPLSLTTYNQAQARRGKGKNLSEDRYPLATGRWSLHRAAPERIPRCYG